MIVKAIAMQSGKRTRKTKKVTKKVTKPFRPPRRGSQGVIPGLLHQTNNEKKVVFFGAADVVNGYLFVNSTGSVVCINLIQVGSSMFNRIGRKIEMHSIRLMTNLINIAATRNTILCDYLRIIVVYDRQTNGALPTIGDIIQDTEQNATNTTTPFSGLNMNNRERFVTLIDHRITIPQANSTAGVLTNVFPNDVGLQVKTDEFRRLRGLTTHYKADSSPAVIGDISTGALFIVTLAAQPAGTELFALDWNVRLKYVDL